MLAERSPDEQSDVGPTLASNVGPTERTTLSQRWPNVVMLSGVFISTIIMIIILGVQFYFLHFTVFGFTQSYNGLAEIHVIKELQSLFFPRLSFKAHIVS